MTEPKIIKIGTRGSPLALAQAEDVKARLIETHEGLSTDTVEIVVIKTSGDRILDRHLMNAGGKGLFTKEIEDALLGGSIDCAVHSAKDMPTVLPDGLILSAFLPRETINDAFISTRYDSFDALPESAVMGTASLRRRALTLRRRPDLKVMTFRGNVQTRLRKLNDGEADATFLAVAGLNRLGMPETITEKLSLEDFPPAPAQGAVTVETRSEDAGMIALLKPLHSDETALETAAERAFLKALDGSCRTPIAGFARVEAGKLTFKGYLLSLDGAEVFEEVGSSNLNTGDAVALGKTLGENIRDKAGPDFFETLKREIAAEFQ
jgi:hydroxymethylbilane synthase